MLERAVSTHEFVEHAVECAESDRQMPLSFFQMRRGVRKPGRKPLAVGERHHEIGASLPDHGRDRDLVQPEAHELVNAMSSSSQPSTPVRTASRWPSQTDLTV